MVARMSDAVERRETGDPIAMAFQDGPGSFHHEAALQAVGDHELVMHEKQKFGDVVVASRALDPGLGIIAVNTAAGTVKRSVQHIASHRYLALAPVVGRVDLDIVMALIGSHPQRFEKLDRPGVVCLGQEEAMMQCSTFLDVFLPQMHTQGRKASTYAVKEVVERDDPNVVAIGPSHSAEEFGGVVLADCINPVNSVTSFYILQRKPTDKILPEDPEDRTSPRAVISLAHPKGEGQMERCWTMAENLGIRIARFLPFDMSYVAHDDSYIERGGGLLEVAHDMYDPEVSEFCARVEGIGTEGGKRSPFECGKLGGYMWYPEESIDPHTLPPED